MQFIYRGYLTMFWVDPGGLRFAPHPPLMAGLRTGRRPRRPDRAALCAGAIHNGPGRSASHVCHPERSEGSSHRFKHGSCSGAVDSSGIALRMTGLEVRSQGPFTMALGRAMPAPTADLQIARRGDHRSPACTRQILIAKLDNGGLAHTVPAARKRQADVVPTRSRLSGGTARG